MIRHPCVLESLLPRRCRPSFAAALFLVGCTLGAGPGMSLEHQAGGLKIEQPWSRPTAPGVSVGVGYMVITNGGQADALVAAGSPVAERVEIHSSRMDGGMMRMRHMERVELPAGRAVKFEPGGLHFMLIGLKQPLAEGSKVPLVLRFAAAGERKVELEVQAMVAPAKDMDHSHH